MSNPLISIVIATYNRANYIQEAICSVQEQTHQNWEMLIIDDASIDNTELIVNEFQKSDSRIHFVKNKTNMGVGKTRNRGFELAKGKYIAVLDSDDLWCLNTKLEEQSDFLENNPDYILVGGGVIEIDAEGKELKRYPVPLSDPAVRRKMLYKNVIAHSGVLFLKEAAVEVGGYDEKLTIAHDYDLWLRLGRRGKIGNLEKYLFKYRRHGGNISSKSLVAMEENLVVIDRYKNDYPGYWLAKARRVTRKAVYSFLFAR